MDFPHFHDLGHKETMSVHGFRWFIAHGTSGSINFIVAVLPLALSSSHGGDAGWVLVSIAHAKVCFTAEALTEPRKPILTKGGGQGTASQGRPHLYDLGQETRLPFNLDSFQECLHN